MRRREREEFFGEAPTGARGVKKSQLLRVLQMMTPRAKKPCPLSLVEARAAGSAERSTAATDARFRDLAAGLTRGDQNILLAAFDDAGDASALSVGSSAMPTGRPLRGRRAQALSSRLASSFIGASLKLASTSLSMLLRFLADLLKPINPLLPTFLLRR
jgi:hypothetical protein